MKGFSLSRACWLVARIVKYKQPEELCSSFSDGRLGQVSDLKELALMLSSGKNVAPDDFFGGDFGVPPGLETELVKIVGPVIERYRQDKNISNDTLTRFVVRTLVEGAPCEDVRVSQEEVHRREKKAFDHINKLVKG